MKEVFIVAAKRTPIGGFMGNLSHLSAPELGAIAIKGAVASAGINPESVDEVYFGNVLSANLGQSPARQAAIFAGIPEEADATTINKVCASGMKATAFGAQQIQLGLSDLVVTGGMESMSNTPHYQYIRKPNKFGHTTLIDGMIKDGLWDVYNDYHMGSAAEFCAREYGFTREDQDKYALASYARAAQASKAGKFAGEIIPVTVKQKTADITINEDEDIYKVIPEKVSKLSPVFEQDGTVTAANASNLNDGAAALVLASKEAVEKYNLKPLAKIIAFADAAQTPERYATTPALAIPKALKMAGLSIDQIDYFEINEAYAVVALANQKILNIDPNKLNAYGGAVAMGHPLGVSGARIICTLLSVLKQEGGKYGVAGICNGGGGASAMVVENLRL
jgi:acetyl-CoA C-acetyltransferase